VNRASDGTFAPGPMSDEMKERISRGVIRAKADRRAQQQERDDLVKRCTGPCGEVKRVGNLHLGDGDFQIRKYYLRDGTVRYYPSGECKECLRLRKAAYMEQFTPEERKRRQKGWDDARRKKRAEGVEKDQVGGVRLDATPLRDWLNERWTASSWATRRARVDETASAPAKALISEVRRGKIKRVTEAQADLILTALDMEHLLPILWPEGRD
jgi:hypothetical protein